LRPVREEGERSHDDDGVDGSATTPRNESEEDTEDNNTPDSTWENIVETFFRPGGVEE
jgi:hypothetical protein